MKRTRLLQCGHLSAGNDIGLRHLLATVCLTLLSSQIQAQRMTLDWAAPTALVCPTETSRQHSIPLTITHLNDVLYGYTVETSTETVPANDFGELPSITREAGRRSGCDGILDTAVENYGTIADKIKNDPKLNPRQKDGSVASIKLADTLKAWTGIVTTSQYEYLTKAVPELKNCTFSNDEDSTKKEQVLKFSEVLQDFQNKVTNNPHEWKGTVPLTVGATNRVSVTVAEMYGNEATKAPVTQQCDIKSSVLSLSAGPLFSTIPARDYVTVNVPNPSGGAPVSQLAVQDNSNLRPLLVGLLNYDLPIPFSTANDFGIQISSGPTFRVGGPNNVSSFGYFGGISIHLWKRFFLTPGVHVAEFADFPLGFSQNSVVPSGFGTLTPIKRWTARFGFSATYRTNSISTLGQQTTTPAPSNPKPAQSSSGRNASSTSTGKTTPRNVGPPSEGTPPSTGAPPKPPQGGS